MDSACSVIVDDFHLDGAIRGPHEADAELIVDSDAVLALALAAQRLQPITGRRPEVAQFDRAVQLREFARGDAADRPEVTSLPGLEERPCRGAAEAPDHAAIVSRLTFPVQAHGRTDEHSAGILLAQQAEG